MDSLLFAKQRRFRATGVVTFFAALGLLLARILASLLPDGVPEVAVDAIFTTLVQVVFLVLATFFTYKLMLKKSTRGVLELSNFRKPDYKIMLLCIPLGVCVLVMTMGISTVWYAFLSMFGYSSGGASADTTAFKWYMLLADIALTAVLPGICEEFTNRGGLLTTMRGSFSEIKTAIIVGVIFGLFHQNITQFFYPMVFGFLMALLVMRTKSIYPAMLVHFMNNALSVYIDYASTYAFLPLSGFIRSVEGLIYGAFPVALMMYAAVVAAGVGLYILILRIAKKNENAKKAQPLYSGEGITILSVDDEEITEAPVPLEDTMLYKPTLRDWAFYIGALAITALTTFVTFYWGLL